MTACNMASSMLDNSIVESTTSAFEACTTIYDSPALQAASEAAEIISDSLPSKLLEDSLEVSNAVIESSVSPIAHAATNMVELFAGVIVCFKCCHKCLQIYKEKPDQKGIKAGFFYNLF